MVAEVLARLAEDGVSNPSSPLRRLSLRNMIGRRISCARTVESCALTKFTVWLKNDLTAATHVDVYSALDVTEAVQQAFEKAAQEWACDLDNIFLIGVAEGDLREVSG